MQLRISEVRQHFLTHAEAILEPEFSPLTFTSITTKSRFTNTGLFTPSTQVNIPSFLHREDAHSLISA